MATQPPTCETPVLRQHHLGGELRKVQLARSSRAISAQPAQPAPPSPRPTPHPTHQPTHQHPHRSVVVTARARTTATPALFSLHHLGAPDSDSTLSPCSTTVLAALLLTTGLCAVLVLGSPLALLGPIVGLVWGQAQHYIKPRPHVLVSLVVLGGLGSAIPSIVSSHHGCTPAIQLLVVGVSLMALASGLVGMVVASRRLPVVLSLDRGEHFLGSTQSAVLFYSSAALSSITSSFVLLLLLPGQVSNCAVGADLPVLAHFFRHFVVAMVSFTALACPMLVWRALLRALKASRAATVVLVVNSTAICLAVAFLPGDDAPLLLMWTTVPLAAWTVSRYTLLAALYLSTAFSIGAAVRLRLHLSDSFSIGTPWSTDTFRELVLWHSAAVLVSITLVLTATLLRYAAAVYSAASGASRNKEELDSQVSRALSQLHNQSGPRSTVHPESNLVVRSRPRQPRPQPQQPPPPPPPPPLLPAQPVTLRRSASAELYRDAQSRFLSGLSHALLTPVHGLIGNAQLLSESLADVDESLHEVVLDLATVASHLHAAVSDVIEFSELSDPDTVLQLHESTFDVADLLDDLVLVCSPTVSHRCVEVFVGGDEHFLSRAIIADRARLLQVLVNVVSNAVKASSSPGSVLVRVSATCEQPSVLPPNVGPHSVSGRSVTVSSRLPMPMEIVLAAMRRRFLLSSRRRDHNLNELSSVHKRRSSFSSSPMPEEEDTAHELLYVTLTIVDSGAGMTSEQLSRAWRPFTHEGSYEPKKGGDGLGLGLNIAQLIVDRLDGHIEVKTNLGRGTSVSISLPLRAVPVASPASPGASPPAGAHLRVLLWSSTQSIRSTAVNQLRRCPVVSSVWAHARDAPPHAPPHLHALLQRNQADVLVVCVTISADWTSPEVEWLNRLARVLATAPDQHPLRLWVTIPGVLAANGHSHVEMDDRLTSLRHTWTRACEALRSSRAIPVRVTARPFRTQRIEHHLSRLLAQVQQPRTDIPASASSSSPPPPPPAATQNPDASQLCHLRCLVVDDNDLNRRLAARICSRLGVKHVTMAVNGLDAVDKVTAGLDEPDSNFHVVFMDITMPRMNGLEASRAILDLAERRNTPAPRIVGLSGNTTEADISAALQVMHAFLGKPFKKEQIKQELLVACQLL